MGQDVFRIHLVWFCIIQTVLLGLVTLIKECVEWPLELEKKGDLKWKRTFLLQSFLKTWCKFKKFILKSILLIINSGDPLSCAGR